MSRRIRGNAALAAAIGAIGLVAGTSRAVPLYWDTDDAAGLQGGDSTWGTAVINWNPANDGSGVRQSWVQQSDAVFTLGGSIQMASHVNATTVTFDAATTILSGTENDPSPFGQPLTVGGNITVNADSTINYIQGRDFVTGFVGGLIKAGNGTLTVNNLALTTSTSPASSTLPTTVLAGTLKLGNGTLTTTNGTPFNFGTVATVQSGAKIELDNHNALFGNITGSGIITNSGSNIVDVETVVTSAVPTSGVQFTGNLNLIKSNNRPVTLTGVSSYTGKTVVKSSNLTMGVNNALPIHTTVEVALGNASVATYDINDHPQEIGAIVSSGTGDGRINNGGGDFGAINLTINGQTLVNGVLTDTDSNYAGRVIGSLNLIKNNANTSMTLTGTSNTYSGTTTINAGVFALDGAHTNSNGVRVFPGGTFAGRGNESGGVSLFGGDINAGRAGSVGTLTVGGLTANALLNGSPTTGSTLSFDLGAPASADNDQIVQTGVDGAILSLRGGTFLINNLGAMNTGTYSLIDYVGVLGGTISNMSVSGPSGFSYQLFDDAATTRINLFVQAVVGVNAQWTGNTDNTWSVAGNWTGGVPDGADHAATFGAISSGQFNVNVDGGKTVGTLNFDNSTPYTLDGTGSITMNVGTGQAAINVVNGSHTIATPLALADDTTVTVTNVADKLTVSGALSASGRSITKAGAGAAEFANVRSAGLAVNSGTVAITANGTDTGSSTITTLTLAGGTAPTATLDLNDNDLVTGTSKATIEAQVKNARNLGPGGVGGWNGTGITSASARNNGQHNTGLGVLSGSEYSGSNGGTTTFDGASFNPSDTIVKYTWNGDANLNGVVNFDDYVKVDVGFNTNLTGWLNGDFNYSGSVNFDDYVLIDVAFNTQSGTFGRAIRYLTGEDRGEDGTRDLGLQEVIQHLGEFGTPYASAFLAAVPEPVGVGALAALGLTMFSRRRRRS